MSKKEKGLLASAEVILKNKKYKCLYPGCNCFSIKSHSQQKNGSLRAIAENGKIMRLDDNFFHSLNDNADNLNFSFVKKGIGESTTFPGFCTTHELIFSVFENHPLIVGDINQLTALHYRTISYEFSRKRREHERWELLQPIFLETRGFDVYNRCFNIISNLKKYSDLTLSPSINKFNEHFSANSKIELKYLWLKIDANLNASCSSIVNMHLDDYIRYATTNPEKPIPFFSLNVIPNAGATNIIFCWDDNFSEFSDLILEQTKDDSSINNFINRLIFCDTEDSCVNPKIWENIENKDFLISNMNHVLTRGELKPWHIPKILAQDFIWEKYSNF